MPPSQPPARTDASSMPTGPGSLVRILQHLPRPRAGTTGEGGCGMIYQAYEAFELLARPLRQIAEEVAYQLSQPWSGLCRGNWPPNWSAAASVLAQARLTHTRPEFGIARI